MSNTLHDDILLNKAATIERGIPRFKEKYRSCPVLDNHTHVDAMVLFLSFCNSIEIKIRG